MWRPSIFSEKIVGILENVLMKWWSVSYACLEAWINKDTYYEWMKLDRDFPDKKTKEKFVEFHERMEKAKETPIKRCREVIMDAAVKKKNRKAAAWFLEKKDPEFKEDKKSDITINNTPRFTSIKIEDATVDDWEATEGETN